jgi:FkbM family methyltransferase
MSYRIKIIQSILHINELLIFYPRLSSYYKKEIKTKNPVIIDVGANRGQTISFFLRYFPNAKIYAFEPNRKLINVLANLFKLHNNIVLLNKAVSDIDGKQTFYEMIADETSTLEELNFSSGYLQKKAKILGVTPQELITNKYQVEAVRLDTFINSMNLKEIDILKIDTEGHEYKCLQGLFSNNKAKINYIQLEHHYDDMYVDKPDYKEIETMLLLNGFVLHKKITHGFGNFAELLFKRTV